MPSWPSADFDSFYLCLMTLTGAAWHQEELQLIQNCIPWVSVENSLFCSTFSCLSRLFTISPHFYVSGSLHETLANIKNVQQKKRFMVKQRSACLQLT